MCLASSKTEGTCVFNYSEYKWNKEEIKYWYLSYICLGVVLPVPAFPQSVLSCDGYITVHSFIAYWLPVYILGSSGKLETDKQLLLGNDRSTTNKQINEINNF